MYVSRCKQDLADSMAPLISELSPCFEQMLCILCNADSNICDLYLWNLAAKSQPFDDNFLDATEACLRSLGVYLGNQPASILSLLV